MGWTVDAYVFYGVELDPNDDEWGGAWPEPYASSPLGGTLAAEEAYLRARLGREPTRDEQKAFDSPSRRYDGVYFKRGPRDEEYRDDLSVVFTLEGGYQGVNGDEQLIHPFVAVRASYHKGSMHGGSVLDPAIMLVDEATRAAWREALRDFCELAKLPFREPNWYITAVVL